MSGLERRLSTEEKAMEGYLREHEPLTELLSQIPQKVQRGMKTQPEVLELTSVDANHYFIALGSNIGTVFLYDRDRHTIQRLRSENTFDSVSAVCLHHGLDDMVATAYESGAIYIFQLPSSKLGHSKQLEKIVVPDLHESPIQCLTWTTNGMKLYSGDRTGSVGCTEVDFYEGKCTSTILLIESKTEIVQLSAGHRSLLVSTKHRCIVCRMDEQNRIVQVGSKERKIFGDFGGCFIPAMCKPNDAQLYASRPGYRIWKASIQGTVNNTFIFKDILSSSHPEIQLLSFETTNIIKSEAINQFGPIHLLKNKYLVTWNINSVYVVDPDTTTLVGSQKYVGYIRSLVVTEDEIFILRMGTDRHVIRIAFKPLPSSSSQVLKQLQDERKIKEKEKEIEEVKETSDIMDSSPFKFIQGNILDKVKKIPKPSVIKEKIQDKLKLDSKSETTSKYDDQGYVFNDDTQLVTVEKQASPPGALPPVIELDSPELLKLELELDHSGIVEDKSLDIQTISQIDGFTELVGDKSLETEVLVTEDQSTNIKKTGTGAFSALARLQEDHKQEEIADPVYRINNSKPDRNVRDPFSFVIQGNEEDSIVFSKKTKGKNKKKKKGTKDQKSRNSHLNTDQDQDNVSIHSSTSIHSDVSDVVINDILPGTNDSKAVTNDNKSVTNDNQTLTLSNLTTTVDNQDICEQEPDHSSSGDKILDNETNIVKSTSDNIRESDIDHSSIGATCYKEEVYKESANVRVNENIQAEFDETIPGKVYTSQIPGTESNSTKYSSLTAEKGQNVSSLDREISRLDSFLSGSSQFERSSSENDIGPLSFTQSQYHDILLKSSKNTEINSEMADPEDKFMVSDKEYKLSSLEKELNELENSTLDEVNKEPTDTTDAGPMPSLGSLDLQQASIYSMYKTPSTSGEDFYSKYGLTSPDISLDTSNPVMASDELAIKGLTVSSEKKHDDTDQDEDEDLDSEMKDEIMESSVKVSEIPSTLKSVNTWTEVNAPGNITCLSVSHSHLWITDKSCNIYYSNVKDIGISWKKATGYANQISVSRKGNIVWRLYKNVVYAGTKITPKHPEGMKWVEAVKDVAYISVSETCAWYIKTSYEVMLQKGLSKDRPCYTAQSVDCSQRLKQIVCQSSVVWALTEKCQWLYRDGITLDCPEGTSWKSGDSGSEKKLFSYISLGDGDLGWAVDVVGQIWFICDVTMAKPRGDGIWWQVPLSSEYLMKDMSAYDLLKSVSRKFDPIKLTMLLSTQSGGLICGRDGVWVCPEYKHTLHVCHGSVQGHLWNDAHPEIMASSSVWKTVLARNASLDEGRLWVNFYSLPEHDMLKASCCAHPLSVLCTLNIFFSKTTKPIRLKLGVLWGQQPNGDLFCFSPERNTCNSVEVLHGSTFVCMSVCPDALWGLSGDGKIFIRTGMSHDQMKGSGWCKLDLSQLDESHLVSISCGKMNVWAVDADGNVFHRIGVKAPTDHSLNAAWLPVDNRGTHFTKVIAGSQDWMVWAIDNRRQVYVRKGITLEMPIGREWVHVSGSPAMSIALSDNYVWAINHSGELLCRHGVTMENVTGDYWKIVPGNFAYITVSPDDNLWGINKEGQLLRRYTKYVINNAHEWKTESIQRSSTRDTSVGSEEGDWEFV